MLTRRCLTSRDAEHVAHGKSGQAGYLPPEQRRPL